MILKFYIEYRFYIEILYRIDNEINEESDWVIESIEAEYANFSIFNERSD